MTSTTNAEHGLVDVLSSPGSDSGPGLEPGDHTADAAREDGDTSKPSTITARRLEEVAITDTAGETTLPAEGLIALIGAGLLRE